MKPSEFGKFLIICSVYSPLFPPISTKTLIFSLNFKKLENSFLIEKFKPLPLDIEKVFSRVSKILSGKNDKIFINHDSNFIYLSRACGYINNYEINNVVIEKDNENWILNSQISSSKIKDEKSIHIKIYH